MRTIFCIKLQKEGEGLEKPPFPGALGDKIFQHISKEAWGLWVKQQTILINEQQLVMKDPAARLFLTQQMEKFLFDA